MNNRQLLLAFLCAGLLIFAVTIILLSGMSRNGWLVERIIHGLPIQ